jgi:hypothetical protein
MGILWALSEPGSGVPLRSAGGSMTEILTESFCERCGTRYTFESSAPRRSRVGRVRTLSKGLRNFVLSDDASLSEAMADARSEEELSATAHQLDAFHKTFNFCLTCRQYTCATCWNTTEGRCLTCAPMPGSEVVGEVAQEMAVGGDGHSHAEIDEAWPEADLERIQAVLGHPPAPESLDLPEPLEVAAGAAIEPDGGPVAEDLVEAAGPDAGFTGEHGALEPGPIETEAAAATGPEDLATTGEPITSSPTTHDDASTDWTAATAAAGAAGSDLIGVAPGQSLEDAIAEYESRLAEQELADARAAAHETHVIAATSDVETPAAEGATPPVAEAESAPAAEATASAADPVAAAALAAAASHEVPDEAPADQPAEEDLAAAPGPTPTAAAVAAEAAAAAEVAGAAPDEPIAPPPAAAPTDVIAQPTWPVAPTGQPTSDGLPAPRSVPPAPPQPTPTTPPSAAPAQEAAEPAAPWLRVAPDNDGTPAPQWPAAPTWPAASGREMPTTLAGRPLLPRDDASALWAASAREVLGPAPTGGPVAAAAAAAPQPCVQCGLSLSANARFCRRCGSRQG